MNIHHLELYYYVATHGGISRAVRHMPYGIQQPAVSSQILALEEELGTRLFERTPFRLTPAGEELFSAIRPFFDSLDGLAARIGKKSTPRLRIGAAEAVLSDYLPPILQRLKAHQPPFRLGLRAMGATEIDPLFAAGEIDIALSPLDRRVAGRLKRELLVSVPLALIVPKASKARTPEMLWADGAGSEPLICLPPAERVCWLFHEELKRRRIEWPVSIEASSVALLTRYVANGYGVGVAGFSPALERERSVRVLPLNDFPPLEIYAVWSDEEAPLVKALLEEVRSYVRGEWSKR
ncbi:LysR family transcriptional regulator [Opitutaceae bacterium EW11]|nr:LysR family transcriptional regulator [Opitutaceae bacterium EW11]